MTGAFAAIALLLGGGPSAASTPAEPKAAPASKLPPRTVPVAIFRNSVPQIAFQSKAIDIPDWAKAEGHNGAVFYWVTVGLDRRAQLVELDRSSGSAEIDKSALAKINSAIFTNATDKDGKPIVGRARIMLEYSKWDNESPGGGIDDYRCADLTREYDWFTKASASVGERIFPLENFYVSRDMLANRENIDQRDRKEKAKLREKFTKEWLGVVKNCRRVPNTRLLDIVKDPEDFRRWVVSF